MWRKMKKYKYPLDMVGYCVKMSLQPARAWFSKRERKVDTSLVAVKEAREVHIYGMAAGISLLKGRKCGKVSEYKESSILLCLIAP